MKTERIYRFIYALLFPLVHLLFPMRFFHRERLPDGPMVLCAPHSSMLDPIFLMMLLGIRRIPRFIAKQELTRIPVVGAILRGMGIIPIDREHADTGAIRTALKVLKSGGIVGIFPEGTRMQEDVENSAKSGAVMLASRTAAPLVPVWLPRKKRLFHRIEIVVGDPYTLPVLRGSGEYRSYADDLMRRIGLLKRESTSCT